MAVNKNLCPKCGEFVGFHVCEKDKNMKITPPEIEETTNSIINDTYQIAVYCDNCWWGVGFNTKLNVPKGTTVADFIKKEECPQCGCKTLRHSKL